MQLTKPCPVRPLRGIALVCCVSHWSVCLLLAVLLTGCDDLGLFTKKWKPNPLGEGYGRFYDLKKYEACKAENPADINCEVFRNKRTENPEFWPYPDAPKIKWPEPAKQVYKPGMNGEEYWRALCEAEGGEFIYKTVDNVEGLYMIRPRKEERHFQPYDPFVMEDPYGHGQGDQGWRASFTFVGPIERTPPSPPKYRYVETPLVQNEIDAWERTKFDPSMTVENPSGMRFQRYFAYDRKNQKTMQMQYVDGLKSDFGYTWRGIKRPHDRELGVAGGELIVIDLKTNDILGVRRGFILGAPWPDHGEHRNFSWTGNVCPQYAHLPGHRQRNKDVDSILWFLNKVLIPGQQSNTK